MADVSYHGWDFYYRYLLIAFVYPILVGNVVVVILANSENYWHLETPVSIFMIFGIVHVAMTLFNAVRLWQKRPWRTK